MAQPESHGDAIGKELPTRIIIWLVVMLKLTSRIVSQDPESLRTVKGISVSVGVCTVKRVLSRFSFIDTL